MDNKLKELRLKKEYNGKLGMTQQEVADEIGVTKRTYIYWEKGERQIKPEKAQKLADFFNVSVGYLLGYDKTIQNEALGSYQNMARLLRTNPDFKNILSEYDETIRKNGKWDLSLLVENDKLPIIEQDIKNLILEEWKKTQAEDYDEEIYGTLSDNISRIYIALGQLPIVFKDFFGSFLTLPTSDKKIVMQLVNSLYEKNKGIGVIEEHPDKK